MSLVIHADFSRLFPFIVSKGVIHDTIEMVTYIDCKCKKLLFILMLMMRHIE